MERFYQGDEEAFTDLHEACSDDLIRQAFTWLPEKTPARHERAEDLASQTFAKAAHTRERVSGKWDPSRGGVRVWLKGILFKQLITFLRTKRGKERLSTDASMIDDNGVVTSMESRLIAGQSEPAYLHTVEHREEEILQAMQHLTPQEQEVLRLKYWKEFRYREIAEQTGMSIPTVSRRIHSAEESLHHHIDASKAL